MLLREVFKHVGLDEEKEYFGLSFQDNKGQVVSHYYRGYNPFFDVTVNHEHFVSNISSVKVCVVR